ncbi:MAG: hypothetical protein NTU80_10830 [Verrucomicrobia bacterium]|nr:hypothetical protein [Verrucomicrobiota bacterium]
MLALAWGVAGVVHHLTFERLGFGSVPGAWYLIATLALVARPSSIGRLAGFLVSTVVVLGREYEVLSNHMVLEFWLALAFLVALAETWRRREGVERGSPERLYAAAAPLLRVAFLMLYGFSLWAKLNTGFFDPQASCAAVFLVKAVNAYGLGTWPGVAAALAAGWPQRVAIGLTLGLELALPVLLGWRRTRTWGLALALGFHVAMGLVPILGISSFSSLAFVCLLPWMPDRAFDRWADKVAPVVAFLERRDGRARILKAMGAMAVFLAITTEYRFFHPRPHFVTVLWLAWSLPAVGLAGWALWVERKAAVGVAEVAGPRPRWLLAMLAPVVVLGVSPYVGFGTQGTFTMFSNLRLQGDSPNHLVARPEWFWTRTEVVRVLGSNHPEFAAYRDGSRLLTEPEFRRLAADIKTDYYVIGIYRGERFLIGRRRGLTDDHLLMRPLSWFERVLIRHRDVPIAEPCPCQW